VNADQLDRLILKARQASLTAQEQVDFADEFTIYRAMALRPERCVHDLVKEAEQKDQPEIVSGFRRMTRAVCPKCHKNIHSHDWQDGICNTCEPEKYKEAERQWIDYNKNKDFESCRP